MSTPTTSVDVAGLRKRLDDANPPRLVDVRTPAEFEAAHIPGSVNVPLDALRARRAELIRHLNGDDVLVCRSGQRAGQAERALAEAGLPGVRVLTGGLTAWQASGAPVNRGRQRWDLERQVRFVAGFLVLLGLLGSLLVPGLQWFSAAIGAGLVFAAVSGTCAMGMLLAKMPWNRTAAFDPQRAIARLAGSR
ncbi:rhodanese-like domain-containing protein [Pseudonocardia bannensis]|uniref:Rhodanese-like domain-containing protein n=1 Tax=Pseudonocardia bannensis TaxID=630973 RepID=A0A848DRS1_9PSEU|nr:rhodanese-like domain-containing protein [Pseudonocardia bannensis]NMH95116.1 rhodanese-like domain-containing protein [Pseudonocardia bannensis]